MKLKEYRLDFVTQLTAIYDVEEAEHFFVITLENLKGWHRADVVINPDAELTPDEIKQWNEVLQALKNQQPIQYIFGKAYFYGLQFIVNKHTLIPRPETEELVEWILAEYSTKRELKILDIGTGSGCIAIALAKNLPNAEVHAIDVSAEALAVAKKNAETNTANVTFMHYDILNIKKLPDAYDCIVSNPPYVRELEKKEIKSNVLDYEPHLALFVKDNDPLIFYKKISELAQHSLNENGKLYFEINQYLGAETVTAVESYSFENVVLKKDLSGNERMLCVTL